MSHELSHQIETNDQPKPNLYYCKTAVWPSAPWLATVALGYGDTIELKHVDIGAGENLEPKFLRINPPGTVPCITLRDETVASNTAACVRWLIERAPNPAGKSSTTDLVTRIHEDDVDPNFIKLAARSDEELEEKQGGRGSFLRNRQTILKRLSNIGSTEYTDFYAAKSMKNDQLCMIYDLSNSTSSRDRVKQGFFLMSTKAWNDIHHFILDDIPAVLFFQPLGLSGGPRHQARTTSILWLGWRVSRRSAEGRTTRMGS